MSCCQKMNGYFLREQRPTTLSRASIGKLHPITMEPGDTLGNRLADTDFLKTPLYKTIFLERLAKSQWRNFQAWGIARLDLQAPLRGLKIGKIAMNNLIAAARQLAAKLDLKRMAGIVTDVDAHSFASSNFASQVQRKHSHSAAMLLTSSVRWT